MPSDIEIAQAATMQPIQAIAEMPLAVQSAASVPSIAASERPSAYTVGLKWRL